MIPFFFSLDEGGQSLTGGQPKPYEGGKNLTGEAKGLQVWQSPTTRGRSQAYSVL